MGESRGARLVNGRPVQLHSLLSAAASGRGGIDSFQNSHTRGGVPLNKGVLTGLEDDDRVVGPAVRDRKEARWQCMFSNACAGPGARANQQVVCELELVSHITF